MLVADQQTQSAMWEKARLRPHFVRSITRQKRPVGKVYMEKDKEFHAEVEEVYVIQIADPKTGKEESIVVDPRHAQSRDHLKLAQEVIEGRVGGLTPIRMQFEKASALDPEGKEIPGTEIERVSEMENPSPTRNESKVFVGDQQIGEWTHEVDAAVDRAVSFKIAFEFSSYMDEISKDPESKEWKEVEAITRKHLAEEIGRTESNPEAVQREVDRFAPTREDFLAGRHADRTGTDATQSVWDPKRSPVPTTHAEQAAYFAQRAVIERFQGRMQNVPYVGSDEQLYSENVITNVERTLIDDKHLPAGRPKRNPEITEMIVDEKARTISTHMLAGYLQTQGAQVKDKDLATELKEKWRMHADIMKVMEDGGVPAGQRSKHYFSVATVRAGCYGMDAGQKVEAEARKSMKFPGQEKEAEGDDFMKRMSKYVSAANAYGNMAKDAGQNAESISFGI